MVKAVDDVTFSLNRGDVLVIAGESGSGKSTIAKLILMATIPDSGKIVFEGEQIKNALPDTIFLSDSVLENLPHAETLKKIRTSLDQLRTNTVTTLNA